MMKFFYLFLFFLCISASLHSQSILGKWKTIDDETNEPRSVVELSERDGKVYGKILKLLLKPGEEQDPVCKECDADDARYQKKNNRYGDLERDGKIRRRIFRRKHP